MEKITNNDEKFQKGIKKAISKGVKYLLKYRLSVIEEEREKKTYDGGATILMTYMQGHYGVDLQFNKVYNNLVKCAQNYMLDHKKPIFGKNNKYNDLFDTNFLRDIYLQKYNQYPLDVYIQKMEKYIQNGDGFLTQMIPILPILDIFNPRHRRYLNVGLALFGLMEKNYQKVTNNKGFQHLKKRVSRELADIFNSLNGNNDPHNLDHTKAYALFLLYLLEESKRIDQDEQRKFIIILLRTQNSMGQWIYSDSYDSVNEINNTILTIFSVINLLNYYKELTESESEMTVNMNNNIIEDFEGGFLTQQNMDKMFTSKVCVASLIEVGTLLLMIIIFMYIMFKLYINRKST